MNILYLHPRSWTGEYSMLAQLRAKGHQVCVLEEDRMLPSARSLTPDFEQQGDGIATLWYNPRRGIERLVTLPWDRYFRQGFDGRNLAHRILVVSAAARHFKPDVIIASDGFSYAIPAAYARRLRLLPAPLIVGFIGGDVLDCPEADYGRRRTPLTDRLIKRVVHDADWLRPVSPKLANVLRADGAEDKRIRVIPSHLVASRTLTDSVFVERQMLKNVIRNKYSLPLDAPLIVSLSGNQKGKGLHVLAKAWPRVRTMCPQARWLLCGPDDPWLHEAVWPVLKGAGIDASVIPTGRLTGRDVFEHLAAADLHVNPTLCEGLNMVTVEAAAVGTPSVCADGAGVAGWLDIYRAGWVVPAGEDDPLADAIIRALREPGQLAGYSTAGRDMAGEFALERIAGQLESLFDEARRASFLEH